MDESVLIAEWAGFARIADQSMNSAGFCL